MVDSLDPVIQWYKTNPYAIMPKQATKGSACFDLHVCFTDAYATDQHGSYIIVHEKPTIVGTGLRCVLPEGYDMDVYIRSGTALKQELFLINSVGIIDNDYRDDIGLLLVAKNTANKVYQGQRIAQARLVPKIYTKHIEIYENPTKTTREGGFGSTGNE